MTVELAELVDEAVVSHLHLLQLTVSAGGLVEVRHAWEVETMTAACMKQLARVWRTQERGCVVWHAHAAWDACPGCQRRVTTALPLSLTRH